MTRHNFEENLFFLLEKYWLDNKTSALVKLANQEDFDQETWDRFYFVFTEIDTGEVTINEAWDELIDIFN